MLEESNPSLLSGQTGLTNGQGMCRTGQRAWQTVKGRGVRSKGGKSRNDCRIRQTKRPVCPERSEGSDDRGIGPFATLRANGFDERSGDVSNRSTGLASGQGAWCTVKGLGKWRNGCPISKTKRTVCPERSEGSDARGIKPFATLRANGFDERSGDVSNRSTGLADAQGARQTVKGLGELGNGCRVLHRSAVPLASVE